LAFARRWRRFPHVRAIMLVLGAAGGSPALDYKNELNQFVQRYVKRPLSKTDIVYAVSKFGAQCQAVVKLNALDGQEYAGELCRDTKSAERSAAEQAVTANMTLVQATKGQVGSKRPAATASSPVQVPPKKMRLDVPEENPALTPKAQLNSLIGKIAKRAMQKGETIYNAHLIGSQYQATVQITLLPGEWANRAWAGHLCGTKLQAEQSAAEQALKDISADAQLMEEASGKKPASKKGGGGRWGQMMEFMQQMMENGGAFAREEVSPDVVKGTVVDWKGSYGWIQPDVPVNHESAQHRGGKVWVHRNDLPEGLTELSEGTVVQFKVYVDVSGLGAQELALVSRPAISK